MVPLFEPGCGMLRQYSIPVPFRRPGSLAAWQCRLGVGGSGARRRHPQGTAALRGACDVAAPDENSSTAV